MNHRIINGYPILPNGRTCNGNGTIVNINARTTYNNGMGNLGLFGAHNVRTNYAPTMDPYAFMAQQNACYDCGGGGGNKFMNALMGVLGFLGVGGGIAAEILGSKKEANTDDKNTEPEKNNKLEQQEKQLEQLKETLEEQDSQIEKLEKEKSTPTTPNRPEEATTEVKEQPVKDTTPAEEAKSVEDPEAAKKAKEVKEKAEAEALEKEGITKTKDGKYQMTCYNDMTGKYEKVTANSVNDVKALQKKVMDGINYQKEQFMNEHGIKENKGRYTYEFTVPYDKNIHRIEFTSLSLMDAVLQEAERIKNR